LIFVASKLEILTAFDKEEIIETFIAEVAV
jgi:hypothetical protein